jgi:acyl dehydratase
MWRPLVQGPLLDYAKAGKALTVGVWAELKKPIGHADVVAFADLLGDNNPVHLDAEYAKKTRWGQPIAHGMLSAGLIGAQMRSYLLLLLPPRRLCSRP